jgi:hypothetical protein
MTNHKRWLLSALMFAAATCALAQNTPTQLHNSQAHSAAVAEAKINKAQSGALLQIVRDATAQFKDVAEAEKAHYSLIFGCVSGPDAGAMGLHFLNSDLLAEVNRTGIFDPARPQIVIYEPQPDGSLRLLGADYIVFADEWKAAHPDGLPPQLMGQAFHFFETPNRFELPAFYTLHVWAWKENPNGAFVNWHPDVSCQSFVPSTTP